MDGYFDVDTRKNSRKSFLYLRDIIERIKRIFRLQSILTFYGIKDPEITFDEAFMYMKK